MPGDLAQAQEFLLRKPLERVQGLASLRRGTARVLAQRGDGVLMYETMGEVPLLFTDSGQAVAALLDSLPQTGVLVSDNPGMDPYIVERLGFTNRQECINVVYQSEQPISLQMDLHLKPLQVADAPLVSAHYSIHDLETLEIFLRAGQILGGYAGDTLVGFTGWHEEGSMGMLHVFEPYRRKGYAYAMEALQINLMLKRQEIPYGQVIVGNHASLALQQKLGLVASSGTVSWLFT